MRRQSGIGAAAAVVTACIFGAALLLSLVTGAGVYRQVEDRVERSASRRVGLTYVTAKIHAHDAAGMVRAGRFGDGDALFLTEVSYSATADGTEAAGGTVWETVIYVWDGSLMELSRAAGVDLGPEAGGRIADMESLSVEADGGLLRVRMTDSGGVQAADVFLRSGA